VKLTTQEEYGLRCLMQIARHGDDASLTIPQLSQLERISLPNVAKIMRLLRRAGFVSSMRGQTGGYTLTRPATEIVVGDVVKALGAPIFDAKFCERHAGGDARCAHLGDCSLLPLLRQVQDAVDQVLDRLTLRQAIVAEGAEAQAGAGPRAVPLPSQGAVLAAKGSSTIRRAFDRDRA
jgi:Rrf2 family protein